ncbi:PP0621 family protein [Pseudomonas sp. DC3000-4b1]|uniref:PP0621 family protein n=1 Tax=unclassified Pseudomonas TaxID=196821 RepID=UPI003CEE2923
MIRLLFWIAIIFLAVWLWRTFKSSKARPSQTAQVELPMVRCAHCGVHLPSDRALADGSLRYCSRAHLEQGPAPRDR